MSASGSRVLALDALRGLAVLVMIQTHALVLLEPGLRAGRLFSWVMRLDGLVAPAFLLAAGYSLAMVQVRPGDHARRSLWRILEVLAAATCVNWAWFPLLETPRYLARLDVLHCVGLSLLLLWPLAVALRRHPRALRWSSLALGAALFAVAPFAEAVEGPLSLALNNRVGVLDPGVGSVFPLLPWAGHVFLGASLGSFGTGPGAGPARRAWRWWLVGAGGLLWAFQDQLAQAYPPHQFWVTNPANSAQRVVLVLLGLGGLERLAARADPGAAWLRGLGWLSRASLPAYVFHEFLLYEGHLGVFGRHFRDAAGVGLYLALLVALVGATVACTLAWRAALGALSRWVRSWAGWPRPAG